MRRLLLALGAIVFAAGCSSQGIYAVPLPGGADLGDNPMHLQIDFRDVLDLVPQSAVKVDGVPVGRVSDIALAPDGWTATVNVVVNDDVDLPANAHAEVAQTNLLGEKFVALSAPPDPSPRAARRRRAHSGRGHPQRHRDRAGAGRIVVAAQRRWRRATAADHHRAEQVARGSRAGGAFAARAIRPARVGARGAGGFHHPRARRPRRAQRPGRGAERPDRGHPRRTPGGHHHPQRATPATGRDARPTRPPRAGRLRRRHRVARRPDQRPARAAAHPAGAGRGGAEPGHRVPADPDLSVPGFDAARRDRRPGQHVAVAGHPDRHHAEQPRRREAEPGVRAAGRAAGAGEPVEPLLQRQRPVPGLADRLAAAVTADHARADRRAGSARRDARPTRSRGVVRDDEQTRALPADRIRDRRAARHRLRGSALRAHRQPARLRPVHGHRADGRFGRAVSRRGGHLPRRPRRARRQPATHRRRDPRRGQAGQRRPADPGVGEGGGREPVRDRRAVPRFPAGHRSGAVPRRTDR